MNDNVLRARRRIIVPFSASARRSWWGLIFTACLALAGCATAFTGSAHIDGGPNGCRAKCTEWDLDFGGMVAMGEYSDACLCVPRESKTKAPAIKSAASAAGAAVGVVVQTRESERRTDAHF